MLSSHKASNNLWPIRVCTPLIHCRFHRFYGGLLLHRCIVFILIFKTSIIDRRWTLCHSVTAYSRALLPSPGVTALLLSFLTCMCRGSPSIFFIFSADLVKTFKFFSFVDQDSRQGMFSFISSLHLHFSTKGYPSLLNQVSTIIASY